MDPLTLIPTGSIAGVLVIVILYLLRQNHADRKQYRDDVAAIHERYSTERTRLDKVHRDEMAEIRSVLAKTREELTLLRQELEAERRAKWQAEDTAAGYRRQLQAIQGDA